MTDSQLDRLCEERQFKAAQRDEIQDTIDTLSVQIGTELALRGIERFEGTRYTALSVQSMRATLDKAKLLEQGVTPEQIEAATDSKVSYSLRVTERRIAGAEPKVKKPGKTKAKKGTPPTPVAESGDLSPEPESEVGG